MYIISKMKKTEKKAVQKSSEKKISYERGLEIVKAIQKKLENNQREKRCTSSNGYSL